MRAKMAIDVRVIVCVRDGGRFRGSVAMESNYRASSVFIHLS